MNIKLFHLLVYTRMSHLPFTSLWDVFNYKDKILIRARICKRLRRPGIDSEDSIPPAYVGSMAGRYEKLGIDSWAP